MVVGLLRISNYHPFRKIQFQFLPFMIRVISTSERNVQIAPPRLVVAAANTSTEVFPQQQFTKGEIASRYIQNVGANSCYYAIGVQNANGVGECDNGSQYHGILASQQQLDVSATRQCVAVFSVAGTTIATTIALRTDLGH